MTKNNAEKEVNQLSESEPRWFAVRTRVKCEKKVAELLEKKKIRAYVPLVHYVKRYLRKTRHVQRPLINSYVFVQIVKNEYVPVLETEHVAGFVRFSKNLLSIPEEEINTLRRIVLESDIELTAVSGQVTPGDTVLITAGPLSGISGKIVAPDGKRRFQVELNRMGFHLLMTIDAKFIEKTGGTIH